MLFKNKHVKQLAFITKFTVRYLTYCKRNGRSLKYPGTTVSRQMHIIIQFNVFFVFVYVMMATLIFPGKVLIKSPTCIRENTKHAVNDSNCTTGNVVHIFFVKLSSRR